ncbi:type III-B CRISPR-associated protein Cas10/Cmr2 [Aceticella autotrophica]|uniref:Type III-B CRISPR-associated protein Cas10/Cmr2 n=1 Tax=Aceticella autotrophica TaxID=2755338 RepID=A0A975AW76_9THEO|nr:type III-B CRISPR-associated protein Cas10/Cmr2 [Aceticella autotrophica]QSZ27584.1 type III-B CRISPR-associated protein Cas10/Cmr2 [Aceticella autotrophica]
MTDFTQKLRQFLHDPVDKCIEIENCVSRAQIYEKLLGVTDMEKAKYSDAIASNMEDFQNKSLFLFTIGPVQQFISQARKTQDLYMGSFLLSYLTFVGMTEIIDKYGPTNIIYPDLSAQPLMDWYLKKRFERKVKNSTSLFIDQPTIPNRFVALIQETGEKEIKELADKIKKNVRKKWKDIVETVLKEFNLNSIVEKQTEDFPEIYWVAVPFRNNDNDVTIEDFKDFFSDNVIDEWEKNTSENNIGLMYQLAYSALEKSIGIRKNLRNFKQTDEYGKKCHVCGGREGVIKAGVGNLKVGKYISKGEGLCVSCFIKRALDKFLEKEFDGKFQDFTFPSTAEVASASFKKKALKNAGDEFKSYIGEFKKIVGDSNFKQIIVKSLPCIENEFADTVNMDAEWFFEDNLTTRSVKKQFEIEKNESEVADLKKSLKKITDKIEKPDSYYAILLFDGDNMGKWLAGELLPDIEYANNSEIWNKLPQEFKNKLEKCRENKFLTPERHSFISHALRNYSIEFVRKIIEEEHLGKLVYSGGDDVLAFVNTEDLFDVLIKLRAAFSGNIRIENNKIKVDWSNDTGFVEKDGRLLLSMGKNATASCGVVIAHYKMPLGMVINRVRETEEKAKNNFGKDSFAILLLKRSGEERIAISKWRYEEIDVLEKLKELSYAFKEKKDESWVSDRIIYTLGKEFIRIKNKDGHYSSEEGIINAEIERIVKRASHGNNGTEGKETNRKVSEILKSIFWKVGNFDRFLNLIAVSAFIAKEE